MRDIDYEFIVNNISTLTKIAIRVYRNHELIIFEDPSHFPTDPASLYIDTLLSIDKKVSYYITEFEHFYGIVKYGEITLVFGPTFQMTPPRDKIREFMFLLNIKKNYYEMYQDLIYRIMPLPLEIFLHELILVYYFISEEKLELSDVLLYDSSTSVQKQNNRGKNTASLQKEQYQIAAEPEHTTVDFEAQLLNCVSEGDLDGLNQLFAHQSSGRAGKTAPTFLRQQKNIFITSTTLISRAAIAGGMPAEEALTLSDDYIQHSESYNNPEQVMNLQYNMVMDYATRVSDIKKGAHYDKFMRSVTSYIQEHLTDEIQVEEMAKELFMSRSYLSTKFKNETGITLSSYIQEQRINKAKDFLKNTDKSILEISTYLGFSSQGYFQNIFKKITGITPKEYRDS